MDLIGGFKAYGSTTHMWADNFWSMERQAWSDRGRWAGKGGKHSLCTLEDLIGGFKAVADREGK